MPHRSIRVLRWFLSDAQYGDPLIAVAFALGLLIGRRMKRKVPHLSVEPARARATPAQEDTADQTAEGAVLDAPVESTNHHIRAEAARRRKRAKSLGIPETVWTLYSKYVKRASHRLLVNRDEVAPVIESAIRGDSKEHIAEICGNRYTFRYCCSPDGFGEFTLAIRDEVALEFGVREKWRHWGTEYSIIDVRAFVEGPWVAELTDALAQCSSYVSASAHGKGAEERVAKTEDLRKRFGI